MVVMTEIITDESERHVRSPKQIISKYYSDNNVFLSPEGVLKVLSVIACSTWSALCVRGPRCGEALAAGLAALAVGAVLAALVAVRATGLALLIPHLYFYMDIIVPSAAGMLLLVMGTLSWSLCQMSCITDYMHPPLAMLTTGMLVASAVITYSSVMRLWDAAAGSAVPFQGRSALEHEA